MLRAESAMGWWLITHPDHARLAGEFAAAWGNAEFRKPDPRARVLRGISCHDDGWPCAIHFAVDSLRDALGQRSIGEGRDLRLFVGFIARHDGGQTRGERLGDLSGVRRRRPYAGRIDAGAAGVFEDRGDHHVEVLLPFGRAIFADHDFAVARAVHLDARVALPGPRGGYVAEHHAAAAAAQDFGPAGVIGRVVAERLRWRACVDQR